MNNEMLSDSGMESRAWLRLDGITKTYAGFKALDQVSMEIKQGTVHGLVGANGAGKSTLIKVLAGVELPDSGEIRIQDRHIQIGNPRQSTELGLSFIHQELNLIQHFNVIQNITLGMSKPTRFGLIRWSRIVRDIEKIAEKIQLRVPLTIPVKELSIADQWLVSIGRALFQNAKMIAMDEPTASLSETEVAMLFQVIRDITAKQNIAVLYVSHRLDEIMDICDEITVMRDGKKVMNSAMTGISKEDIIDVIAGFHVTGTTDRTGNPAKARAELLEVDGIRDGSKVNGVSFKLHQGEILGLTGLVGAGRTELARLIFGDSRPVQGLMKFKGRSYTPRNPMDAIRQGIALIPEDRRSEGLVLSKSVNFNINLPNLHLTRTLGGLPFVSPVKAERVADDVIRKLRVKTQTANSSVQSLSGGNQQKVVVGKWLQRQPELVIMDEPTNGVDVGARSEIYQMIREMSENGTSFLIISSDIEELPGLCDRVLVMVEGGVSGQLEGADMSKEAILKLCYASPRKYSDDSGKEMTEKAGGD